MKKLAAVIGLGLALVFGGHALAKAEYGGGYHCGYGEHHRMPRMLSKLDLSDEQQHRIEGIRSQTDDQIAAFKQNKPAGEGDFRQQMKALVHTATFDEARFRQLLAQRAAKKSEMAVLKAKMRNRIWNVLTPGQQSRLDQMPQHKHGQHKRHHGHCDID